MEPDLPVSRTERVVAFQAKMLTGPLPDPETLREYNDLMPGAADRIFALAERDQSFQHNYRFRAQKNKHTTVTIGQVGGILIAIAGIAGAVILSIYDKPIMGAIAFIGAVGTLIVSAVYSRAHPPAEQKVQQLPEQDTQGQ